VLFRLNRVLGSSPEQTAKAFLVADETVASWNIRVDKAGDQALVQIAQPVNKLPDIVRRMVQRLKTLCPWTGKKEDRQGDLPRGFAPRRNYWCYWCSENWTCPV